MLFDDYIPYVPQRLRLDMAGIQYVTAQEFQINIAEMESRNCAPRFLYPRQAAMYLCRELMPRSLQEIGRAFGGRHHTIVMEALRAVPIRMELDSLYANRIIHMREYLERKQGVARGIAFTL